MATVREEVENVAGQRVVSTALDAMLHLSAVSPGKIGVTSYLTNRADPFCLSYGRMAELVDKLALKLTEFGVGKGDFVSCQLPNRWEFVIAHLAASRIGAISNPIMPVYGKREISSMLSRTRSKVCIGLARNGRKPTLLEEISGEITSLEKLILIDDDTGKGLEDHLAGVTLNAAAKERLDRLKPDVDDLDVVMFSSGTTGEPKGVLHSHRSLFHAISAPFARMKMNEEDVVLTFSPMGHATGFNNGIEMPLHLRCRSVLQEVWDPAQMLRIVEREGVTWTMGSAAFAKDVCDIAEIQAADTATLRCFTCGGAPIPPQLIERAKRLLGTTLIPCWGMTEAGITTAGRLTDSDERQASSDGCPVDGVELRVVHEHGEPLRPKTEGHVQLRAPGQHVGYFENKALYAESFEDGWYKTGDLGWIDDEGYIRIVGRSKEIVIRGGENVPILEIENMLRAVPGLADIVIVGVPDDRLGERCHAVVVPASEDCAFSLADLTGHLAGLGVTKQYWPEFLSLRQSLPRTATGKVQRFQVRDDILSGD